METCRYYNEVEDANSKVEKQTKNDEQENMYANRPDARARGREKQSCSLEEESHPHQTPNHRAR